MRKVRKSYRLLENGASRGWVKVEGGHEQIEGGNLTFTSTWNTSGRLVQVLLGGIRLSVLQK